MSNERFKTHYSNSYYKEHKRKRTCLEPGCNSVTVKSHVISKSKYLKPLCDNSNKLYELFFDHRFDKLRLKQVGYKEAFQFEGFCASHDAQKFSQIDNEVVDYHDYKIQLLLCYRSYFNEMRKKEVALISYNKMGQYLNKTKWSTVFFQERMRAYQASINDQAAMKLFLDAELVKQPSERSLFFITHELPYLGIASSTGNGSFVDGQANIGFVTVLSDSQTMKSYLILGVSIFPDVEATIDWYKQIGNWPLKDKLKWISDYFMFGTETWGVSIKFFNKFLKGEKATYIEKYRKHLVDKKPSPPIPFLANFSFNLFEKFLP